MGATQPTGAVPASLAERYLLLGLRLGRRVDGLVDAFFGPSELAEEVAREPPADPAALVGVAEALLAELPDGWLRDQVSALRTSAGVLAGEAPTYDQEVLGHFGVPCAHTDEPVFAAAHERLDALLPGRGPLAGRHARWRIASPVPVPRIASLMRTIMGIAREWTRELTELPQDESVALDLVRGVPWLAYCEYLGSLRSRISVNVDLPLPAVELLRLALHEAYPGHHAERVAKDQGLVRGRGQLEETLAVATSPQALVSEGIAEIAPLMVLDGPCGRELAGAVRAAGIGVDLDHALAVERAAAPLRRVEVNAARMRHGSGADTAQVVAYLRRWGLMHRDLAEHVARFLDDPASRTYPITYAAGAELCRGYVGDRPERLRDLLTEQVRVGDLAGGRGGGAAAVRPEMT